MSDSESYKNWKWLAPLGLLMTGMGLSFIGEATIWKFQELYWLNWVGMGTLGLVIFNAGLSIFGHAVKRRVWDEWHQMQKQQKNDA